MQQKDNLHPYQMQILHKIMLLPKAKFSDLKLPHLETDLQTYHINELIKKGFIERHTTASSPTYALTLKGKQYINTFDTESKKQEIFGKRGVLLRTIRFNEKAKDYEYLVYKRLKQPFYGFYGFHTGKVREGETIITTARREYLEETGLKIIDFEFVAIFHMIDYDQKGIFVRDIYLYTFNIFRGKAVLKIIKAKGLKIFG